MLKKRKHNSHTLMCAHMSLEFCHVCVCWYTYHFIHTYLHIIIHISSRLSTDKGEEKRNHKAIKIKCVLIKFSTVTVRSHNEQIFSFHLSPDLIYIAVPFGSAEYNNAIFFFSFFFSFETPNEITHSDQSQKILWLFIHRRTFVVGVCLCMYVFMMKKYIISKWTEHEHEHWILNRALSMLALALLLKVWILYTNTFWSHTIFIVINRKV